MRYQDCGPGRLCVGFMVTLMTGCGQPAPPAPMPSPDGKSVLTTSINQSQTDPRTYLCVKFQITDKRGKVLHEAQTQASDRMRWSLHWEGNNRVVLKSSDIGTYAWKRQANGQWKPET